MIENYGTMSIEKSEMGRYHIRIIFELIDKNVSDDFKWVAMDMDRGVFAYKSIPEIKLTHRQKWLPRNGGVESFRFLFIGSEINIKWSKSFVHINDIEL